MLTIPDIRRPRAALRRDGLLARRVGLVVLATDHTTEADFRRMVAGDGIGVYVARIPYANPVTPETLRRMEPEIEAGAGLILPGETLDAVCYSCTSASVVIGEEAVTRAVGRAKPGVPVVTPPDAAARALRGLGAGRISILTPYTAETSEAVAGYFAGRGFGVASLACLGLHDDREMARIAPDSLVEAAIEAVAPDADALFISCTALRSAMVAATIETAIGRPVVTSNLATAWACLRLCGDALPRPELGRVMTLPGGAAW